MRIKVRMTRERRQPSPHGGRSCQSNFGYTTVKATRKTPRSENRSPPAPETFGGLLVGRTVKGIGGTGRGTEYVTLNLTGINMLFVTTQGLPRILFQKYPAD
jgi:hypothetical protein